MKKRYLIPHLDGLDDYVRFADKYDMAFEYNDFFQPEVLDNPHKIKQIIRSYEKVGRDISEDTLHGAFLDITINSSDSLIRRASRTRVRQSMGIAERFGLRAVIFHTNYIPTFMLESYRGSWVEDNAAFWREILCEYPKLCVYVENMFDLSPDLLYAMAKQIHSKRFGVCFDYGHAALSDIPLEEWTKTLAPLIRHIHINDNNLTEDLHLPVGSGMINWNEYKRLISQYKIEASVLLEVKGVKDLEKSIMYMEENGLYPYEPKV